MNQQNADHREAALGSGSTESDTAESGGNSAQSLKTLHAWVALSRCPQIGPVLARRLVESVGGAEKLLSASYQDFAAVDGIGPARARAIADGLKNADAEKIIEEAGQRQIRIICPADAEWPPGLLQIPDPPVILYLRGRLLRQDALAVGIVGSRRCTLYGREQSDKFAAALAELGVTVISGGARGIDTAGHTGALRAGGRTIIVQGCGLEHCYPPENLDLYDRIVREDRGAVISELPPGEPPLPENFPPRNRIITGMSLGILVVEANLRSGSLITARLAADDYGREVFAVPGRIDSPASSGTHHLIKMGSARLVENVTDILEGLGHRELLGEAAGESAAPAGMFPAAGRRSPAPVEPKIEEAPQPDMKQSSGGGSAEPAPPDNQLTGVQRTILTALKKQAMAPDDICETCELPAGVVIAEITFLQIRGLIKRDTHGLLRPVHR